MYRLLGQVIIFSMAVGLQDVFGHLKLHGPGQKSKHLGSEGYVPASYGSETYEIVTNYQMTLLVFKECGAGLVLASRGGM